MMMLTPEDYESEDFETEDYLPEDYCPRTNSRLLDVHKWTDYPLLLEGTKRVWEIIFPKLIFTTYMNKLEKHLRVFLINLYKAYKEDESLYIGYSRDKNHYKKKSRYNKLHIQYAEVIEVADALIAAKLVDVIGFFHSHDKSKPSFSSRMKATHELIRIIEQGSSIPLKEFKNVDDEEVIILKDENKKIIDYVDTDKTIEMRNILKSYNELLFGTDINIDLKDVTSGVKIYLYNKKVKRIFNDSAFYYGGRFYGGWWQTINSKLRSRITLNGEQTIELDYKAMHIYILYMFEGIHYYEETDVDPYVIEGLKDAEKYRDFFKLALLIIINAKNISTASGTITKKAKIKGYLKPPNMTTKQCIELFEEKHKHIRKYFYSGYGTYLQRSDSSIAEHIINTMTNAGIPILCVHDSFICRGRDEDILHNCLNTALDEMYGWSESFKIDKK